MVIGGTVFPHRKVHLATWRSPDGTTNNQIYHILIDARHKDNMMDVRTYRGANVDSDHYLVITRIRAKISRSKYIPNKEKTVRYNISNLKQTEVKKEYEQKIKDLCQKVGEGVTVEDEWTNFETILKTAAEESIGKVKRDIRNGWFDQECEQVTLEKNRKYQSMLQRKFTRAAREEYCKARRKEKRIHKKKKKDYYEKQLKWLQQCDANNESRKFYKQVNRTRDGFQARPSCS
jgi:hypothetical protein